MGVFEFECADGHVTEWFGRSSERPATYPCGTCGNEANFVLSATPTTFHAADRKAIKGATISRAGTRT